MNESIERENTIIIDGQVKLEDYRIFWRERYARELPNTLIFYGILVAGALFSAYIFRGNLLGFAFFLFAGFMASVPIFLSFYNYYGFISQTRKYIDSLSERERYFNLVIKPGANGIECVQGDNYSFLAWNSIRGAVEKDGYFSLEFKASPFLIMKNEFRDESDIRLFRATLSDKFGARAKLLP